MKRFFRIVITFGAFFFFPFIQMYVHELGHAFFIIITGNEFIEIKFGEVKGVFCLITSYISNGNQFEQVLINMGGHVFIFSIFLPALYLSIRFKKPIFVNVIILTVFSEVFYMCSSSFLLCGDLYNFFVNLNLSIDILQMLSIPLLILSLFLLCYLLRYNHKNINYYIVSYYKNKKYDLL